MSAWGGLKSSATDIRLVELTMFLVKQDFAE